jgi:hypothetical protein
VTATGARALICTALVAGRWRGTRSARTALVAERDGLRKRVAELEALSKPVYISHGQRVESIDLRERLVCAALTGCFHARNSNLWIACERSLHALARHRRGCSRSRARRDAEGGGMSDWMAGMSDFQREEVARMESRAHPARHASRACTSTRSTGRVSGLLLGRDPISAERRLHLQGASSPLDRRVHRRCHRRNARRDGKEGGGA